MNASYAGTTTVQQLHHLQSDYERLYEAYVDELAGHSLVEVEEIEQHLLLLRRRIVKLEGGGRNARLMNLNKIIRNNCYIEFIIFSIVGTGL